MSLAGMLRMQDGYTFYATQAGNWRKVYMWVEGEKLFLAEVGNEEKGFGIEGEFAGLANLPVK